MTVKWGHKRLRDVAVVSTGPFGSLLHKSDYTNDGVPLVNPINIRGESIVPDPAKLIGTATKRRLNSYVLEDGDVVVGRRGEIGRCAVIGPREAGWVCGTGSFFVRSSPSIDSNFLAHLLRSSCYRVQLEKASTGATMSNLSNEALGNLAVPVPPLEEQKRIVSLINEVSEEIGAAINNVEKSIGKVRGLFESYLSYAFAKGDGAWLEHSLESLVEKTCSLSYGIVQPGDEVSGGMPIVRPTDMKKKIIGMSGLKRINSSLAKAYEKTVLVGEEVLLCVRGTTGALALAAKELRGANVTRGIVPIRFNPSMILQEFGYYLLSSRGVQSQIKAATYGAALMQVNIRDVRRISLPVPPVCLQADLLKKLSSFDDEVRCLEFTYDCKAVSLVKLKDAILQKALSGELLSHLEVSLPEAAE